MSYYDWPVFLHGFSSLYDDAIAEGANGAFDDLLNSLRDDADGPKVDLRRSLFDKLPSLMCQIYDYRGRENKTESCRQAQFDVSLSQGTRRRKQRSIDFSVMIRG